MKYKSMRYEKWILCLLTILWCGIARADLSVLEKLRSNDSNRWYEVSDVGYDLALMGDDAVPFLIQTLTDKDRSVRLSAIGFLANYASDTRVLPALTEVFSSDPDQSLRLAAAMEIANINPDYARPLLIECLAIEIEPGYRLIAVNALEELGEERALPMFVLQLVSELEPPNKRWGAALRLAKLKDKRAVPVLLNILNNTELEIYNKSRAALALARFKDKRAVPFLLDTLRAELDTKIISLNDLERVLETLTQLGDERTIPVLLDLLPNSRVGRYVADALPQFGPGIVPPLLEMWEQTNSQETRDLIAHVLQNIHHPELASIYGQTYLEIEDYRLRDAMSHALPNMGVLGFEYLLKIAKQKPDYRVWHYLSTYNGKAAIDAVVELALDESYPHRTAAIDALGSFSKLWKAEIAKHIPPLLADADPAVKINTMYLIQKLEMAELWKAEIANHIPQLLSNADPSVKFRTVHLIKRLKMVEMTPALQKLTQSTDEPIRNAAHNVLAVLSETESLKLDIEMNRPRYDYGQSIDLTCRITNVSPHPVTISTAAMHLPDRFLMLEIQLPDGTFARSRYGGSKASFAPPRWEDYQPLKPGGELTVTVSISEFYWLHQPGHYTIQIQFRPFADGFEYGFIAWTRTLTSPKAHFDIEPPTADQLNTILARIDAKPDTEATRAEAFKTCHQLGELRRSEAIPALKKLALVYSDGDHDIRKFALSALARFSNRDLTPMWIEILDDVHSQSLHITAIKGLGMSGGPGAIEPLWRAAYRSNNYRVAAVLALQKLGDDSGVEWLREIAWGQLQHWSKETREGGIRILRELRRNEQRSRHYQSPDSQYFLTWAWFSAMIADRQIALDWLAAGANRITVADVEGLLKHSDPVIQQTAAYQLARLGNASGAHLIQPDLYADDARVREKARAALLNARSQ